MTHITIGNDMTAHIPVGVLFAIAEGFALITATMLGGALAKENDGHLEIAWTKPVSRERLALASIVGSLSLALRAAGTTTVDPTRRVTITNLGQREAPSQSTSPLASATTSRRYNSRRSVTRVGAAAVRAVLVDTAPIARGATDPSAALGTVQVAGGTQRVRRRRLLVDLLGWSAVLGG